MKYYVNRLLILILAFSVFMLIWACGNEESPAKIPSGLTIIKVTSNSVTLGWDSADGAKSYIISRSMKADGTYVVVKNTGVVATTTTTSNSAASTNTTGTGTTATTGTGTTATTGTGTTATTGTGTTATTGTGTTATTGTAGTGTTGSAPAATDLTAKYGNNVYTDENLDSGTTYFYKIKAVNADGDQTFDSAPYEAETLLEAPKNLTANFITTGIVKLTWSNQIGADSYNVYRAEADKETGAIGTYSQIGRVTINDIPAGTVPSFYDMNCVKGTTNYYKVAGVNKSGEGDMSIVTNLSYETEKDITSTIPTTVPYTTTFNLSFHNSNDSFKYGLKMNPNTTVFVGLRGLEKEALPSTDYSVEIVNPKTSQNKAEAIDKPFYGNKYKAYRYTPKTEETVVIRIKYDGISLQSPEEIYAVILVVGMENYNESGGDSNANQDWLFADTYGGGEIENDSRNGEGENEDMTPDIKTRWYYIYANKEQIDPRDDKAAIFTSLDINEDNMTGTAGKVALTLTLYDSSFNPISFIEKSDSTNTGSLSVTNDDNNDYDWGYWDPTYDGYYFVKIERTSADTEGTLFGFSTAMYLNHYPLTGLYRDPNDHFTSTAAKSVTVAKSTHGAVATITTKRPERWFYFALDANPGATPTVTATLTGFTDDLAVSIYRSNYGGNHNYAHHATTFLASDTTHGVPSGGKTCNSNTVDDYWYYYVRVYAQDPLNANSEFTLKVDYAP